MGVGQHYLQAAWIGKHFGQRDDNNKFLSEKEKNDIRNYVIPLILLKDIYSLDSISIEKLNNLVKLRPVKKIYTSGSIISKEIENSIKINGLTINEIESASKHIRYIIEDFNNNSNNYEHIEKLIPFIALHESRNISLFLEYNDMLKKIILGPLEINTLLISRSLKHCEIINNNFLEEITKKLIILKYKQDNIKDINTLSREIYNHIYPKLIEIQIKQYKNYEWLTVKIEDNHTLGINDKPVINFSLQQMNLNKANFLAFDLLPNNYKNIINNSTLCLISKSMILIGFDKKHNFTKTINVNEFIKTIYDFVALTFFMHSYDFYTFTSDINKKIIFDLIVKGFNELKSKYLETKNYRNRN